MDSFSLDKAKGVLKKCTTSKTKGKEDGKAVLTNDVLLHVRVDSRAEKAVDHLFPGFKHVEQCVAARDGDHHGLKLQARGDVGEINVTVFDGGGNKEVFAFQGVRLKGSPTLLVNSLGDSHLVLRVDAHLSRKDMGALVDYIDADVYVTAEVTQPELPMTASTVTAKIVIAPAQTDLTGPSGDEVRQAREERAMTRGDLVLALEAAGHVTSVKSLQRYESGERQIPPELASAALVVLTSSSA